MQAAHCINNFLPEDGQILDDIHVFDGFNIPKPV